MSQHFDHSTCISQALIAGLFANGEVKKSNRQNDNNNIMISYATAAIVADVSPRLYSDLTIKSLTHVCVCVCVCVIIYHCLRVRTTATVAYCALNCKQQRTTGSWYIKYYNIHRTAGRARSTWVRPNDGIAGHTIYDAARHCFIITILLVACYIPVYIRIYRAIIYNITVRHLASLQREREREREGCWEIYRLMKKRRQRTRMWRASGQYARRKRE